MITSYTVHLTSSTIPSNPIWFFHHRSTISLFPMFFILECEPQANSQAGVPLKPTVVFIEYFSAFGELLREVLHMRIHVALQLTPGGHR